MMTPEEIESGITDRILEQIEIESRKIAHVQGCSLSDARERLLRRMAEDNPRVTELVIKRLEAARDRLVDPDLLLVEGEREYE